MQNNCENNILVKNVLILVITLNVFLGLQSVESVSAVHNNQRHSLDLETHDIEKRCAFHFSGFTGQLCHVMSCIP